MAAHPMIVGAMELDLRLDGCYSLKDKRRVLRSVMDRARRELQIAIAEVDDCDLWNSAVLGAAYVSNDATHVERVLQSVVDRIDAHPEIALVGVRRRIARD